PHRPADPRVAVGLSVVAGAVIYGHARARLKNKRRERVEDAGLSLDAPVAELFRGIAGVRQQHVLPGDVVRDRRGVENGGDLDAAGRRDEHRGRRGGGGGGPGRERRRWRGLGVLGDRAAERDRLAVGGQQQRV